MINFIKKNIRVIEDDPTLIIYGAILCLIHAINSFLWMNQTTPLGHVCWSFAPDCKNIAGLIVSYQKEILLLYFFFSVLTGTLLLLKKVRWGYGLFLFLEMIKLGYHLSDYRHMGNYHYMVHIINFLFLFALNKKNIIKLFLVLFYLGAGIIKFNTDWLSGMALLAPTYLLGKWLEWACVYVIILELLFVFGLLSNKKNLRSLVLIQLIAFHLYSWHIVGYYYPCIMLGMISLFIIDKDDFRFHFDKKEKGYIVFFVLAQAIPLIFSMDSGLTGKYRVLSLNMLDAKSVCETNLFLKYKNKTIEYNPDFLDTGVRIQCDPILTVNKIYQTCEDQKKNADFLDIDFNHQVKRISSAENIIDWTYRDVCKNKISISFFGEVGQQQ